MFDIVADDFNIVPYALPNLDQNPNGFLNFVNANVEEQLREMLGDFFYDAMTAALALIPDWVQKVTPNGYAVGAQVAFGNDVWQSLTADNVAVVVEGANWHKIETNNRWMLLKNGTDYSYANYPYKWVGMHAMLVPMVYALYTTAMVKQQTQLGVVIPSSENSEVVSSGDNIVRGWNKYSLFAIGRLKISGISSGLYGYLYYSGTTFNDLFAANQYGTMQAYLANEFCPPTPQNVFDL